jgi:hypothetical protein
MAIQPQIAMGFRPPQIESPLNMMSQFAQLQSAQQANALRQAQMQKMQLDEERRNALMMRAQSGAPLTFADVVPFGEQGFAALKAQQDQLKAQQEAEALKQEQIRKRQETFAQTLFNLRDDPSVDSLARAWQTLKEGGMGEGLEATVAEMLLMTPEQRRAAADQYVRTTPGMDRYIADLKKTAAETALKAAQARDVGQVKPPAAVQEAEWYRTATPEQRQAFDAAKAAGRSVTHIVNPQESAFQRELGAVKGKQIQTGLTAAQDAVSILDTISTGRNLLDSGLITGFGANFLVNAGQALKQAGIDLAADASANTQAYTAALAANVGRIIKQFGAGTGLSNADREYAEKMAGGNVTLDERALRRILDINERAARNTIKTHNQNVEKFGAGEEFKIPEPKSQTRTAPPKDQQPLSTLTGDQLRRLQPTDLLTGRDRQAYDAALAAPGNPDADAVLRQLRQRGLIK